MGRDAKRFSSAEWQELLRRSRAMSAAAPADIGVQEVRETDVVDDAGSDAASDAGDAGDGGAALPARLPELVTPSGGAMEVAKIQAQHWQRFLTCYFAHWGCLTSVPPFTHFCTI